MHAADVAAAVWNVVFGKIKYGLMLFGMDLYLFAAVSSDLMFGVVFGMMRCPVLFGDFVIG